MNRLFRAALFLGLVGIATTAAAQDGPKPQAPPASQPMTPIMTPAAAQKKADADADADTKPVYDEKADAKEQIAKALAAAKANNQRVLIQWGGNWCPWCIQLHKLMRKDRDLSKELFYEYIVVFVDTGRPAGKNVELATSYGADLKKHGYPYLTILDADGRPVANEASGQFEKDAKSVEAGHDAAKIVAMLKKHEATPLDAKSLLESALSAAKKDGKQVFLHFGAPWCGWCRKLEAWMAKPDVATILAKDFVDLKIDIDRMTNGREVLAKYAGTDKTGIPWFAFIDAEGKTVADSNQSPGDARTNIGYPAPGPELEFFEKMLAKAVKKITTEDIAALHKSLGGK